MDHNIELARLIWEIIVSVACLANFVLVFFQRRSQANKSAVEELRRDLTKVIETDRDGAARHKGNVDRAVEDLRIKLRGIDEHLKHLPTGNDFGLLRDAMSQMLSQIAELRGAQIATTRLVETMNSYLMERGK